MKRLYLAGKMTGLPDHNFPAFNAMAARLRALGWVIMNPAEINANQGRTWAECLRHDIPVMLSCDGVATLEGWEGSEGARLEVGIAIKLEMPCTSAEEIVYGPSVDDGYTPNSVAEMITHAERYRAMMEEMLTHPPGTLISRNWILNFVAP